MTNFKDVMWYFVGISAVVARSATAELGRASYTPAGLYSAEIEVGKANTFDNFLVLRAP